MTTTWTSAALDTLETHLQRNRSRIAASGADSDEVVADLRRHVEEEVAALHLPVVTEQDVQRILRQIEPLDTDEQGRAPSPTPPNPFWRETWKRVGSAALFIFGVLLPAFTLGFELVTDSCADLFFDPVPTWFHVVLVALVPVANLLAWVNIQHWPPRARHAVWIANGVAMGCGLFYAGLFLPMTPYAVIGILFVGFGLLPLTPLCAFIAAWRLRKRLRVAQRERLDGFRGWWWAASLSLAVLLALALPAPLTRHWIDLAGSDSPEESTRAIKLLRDFGSEAVMLRECYGRTARGVVELYGGTASRPEVARNVFYRVTGKPFNSVPPPVSKHERSGRAILDDWDFDSALGGDAVAGQVKGLSMMQSRLDGLCNADEGWAYVEWILEFKNEHRNNDREARAQIQLPPGAVVSRLTLWVNGEEREAAFAGRSEVRAAYQKVAVQQRRDPVLVTMSGPDRVLMQCFPVPRSGGTMKVRLGITAPLVMENNSSAALRLPSFAERNFKVGKSVHHNVWLEAPQNVRSTVKSLTAGVDSGRRGVRGSINAEDFDEGAAVLRFERSATAASVLAIDRRTPEPTIVRQSIATAPREVPSRCAIVIDGSVDMGRSFREIASALNGFPSQPELSIWFVQDGVANVFNSTWARRQTVGDVVGRLRARGGQDDVPALLQAWEWAAARPKSAIIWIHGAQPVSLENMEALKQRLDWRGSGEAPLIYDVAVKAGPNRIAEELASSAVLVGLPRISSLSDDLDRLFGSWNGRRPELAFVRSVEKASPNSESSGASSHVVRLWAFDEIQRKIRARAKSDAIALAQTYQLVTPVSGAVVLETRQQFESAGLTPVDPSTVPTVPEPGTIALVVLGVVAFWLMRKRRAARA